MINFSKTTVLGRLGKDAVFKKTASEKDVCTFSVAVNGHNKTTQWFNVVLFPKTEKQVAYYRSVLKKGAYALVEGQMKSRESSDRETGVKKTIWELVGDSLEVSSETKSENRSEPSYQPARAPAPAPAPAPKPQAKEQSDDNPFLKGVSA